MRHRIAPCAICKLVDNFQPKRSCAHQSIPEQPGIEQDHRGVKLRIGPMLGFKRFETAAITIAGTGTAVRRIHKGQFNIRRLRLKGRSAPAIRSGMQCWRYDTQQIALDAQIGQLWSLNLFGTRTGSTMIALSLSASCELAPKWDPARNQDNALQITAENR